MTNRDIPGSHQRKMKVHSGLRDRDLSVHTSGMADSPDIKAEARRLVDNLPAGAGWDDLMYEIYVRQAVEAGLAEADARGLMEHDEAMARIRARIRRAS